MDEGEFADDELNETFGRRIFMSDDKIKQTQIGWFIGTGLDSKLHGYGKIENERGLYQNGTFMENRIEKINTYDPSIEFFADPV